MKNPRCSLVKLFLLFITCLNGELVQAATVANCDEASLRLALAAGGTVTFACDGVIGLSSHLSIAADTLLDASGHNVTISGGNAVRLFVINPGVTLRLVGLTLADG